MRYFARKHNAERRPRIQGRFATKEQIQAMAEEAGEKRPRCDPDAAVGDPDSPAHAGLAVGGSPPTVDDGGEEDLGDGILRRTSSGCDSEDLSDACMGMDFMRDDALCQMPGML